MGVTCFQTSETFSKLPSERASLENPTCQQLWTSMTMPMPAPLQNATAAVRANLSTHAKIIYFNTFSLSLFPTSLCGVLVFWLPSRPPRPSAAAAAPPLILFTSTHHHPHTHTAPHHPLHHPLHLSHSPSSSSHLHITTLTHIQLHIILFTSPSHIISTDHHPHAQ